MKKGKKFGNRLFVNPAIRDKEKHPSIKNLLSDEEEKNKIKTEFNDYLKKDDNEKNVNLNFDDKNNCNYCFNIFSCETQLYNPNDNFYIPDENNYIENKELSLNKKSNKLNYNKINNQINNNNFYCFNEAQLKLDYKITDQIKCNQDYEKIERNFIPFLNVSKC